MNRDHLRRAVLALTLGTFLVFIGQHSAFALNTSMPRAEGAGWYNNIASQEVKFGITLTYDRNGNPQGRFDYFNTVTGLTARGRLMPSSAANSTSNSCGDFGPLGPPPTAPSAALTGECDGGTCSFTMQVVDGGSGKNSDGVCHVHVTGLDRNGNATSDNDDSSELLFRGNINVQRSR
jgi:hypothetical protein